MIKRGMEMPLSGRSSWLLIAILLSLILLSVSLAHNDTVILNVMIDVNSFPSPTSDQENLTHSSLVNLTNTLSAGRLSSTYYLSGEAIPVERLYLTYLGESSRRELAMGSTTIDEKLGSMSSSKQREQLERMKRYVKACHVCGGKRIEPKGFRPQSLSQSNATYQALADMGIVYDAGFIAGLLYYPGHESDAWPYLIEPYNIYAVPISSYNFSGEPAILSDRYAKERRGLNSSQWYELLIGKFDESSDNDEPMVVVFDNLISGVDIGYFEAFERFIDYASARNATFVTTMELVNISAERPLAEIIHSPSNKSIISSDAHKNCTICETLESISIEDVKDKQRASNASSIKPTAMPKAVMIE